jgi:hypothetical protein
MTVQALTFGRRAPVVTTAPESIAPAVVDTKPVTPLVHLSGTPGACSRRQHAA